MKIENTRKQVPVSQQQLIEKLKRIVDICAFILAACITVGMLYAGIKVDDGGGFMMIVFWLCLMVGVLFLRFVANIIVLILATWFARKA